MRRVISGLKFALMVFVGAWSGAVGARSADGPTQVQAYTCTFEAGAAHVFDKGAFKTDIAETLSFGFRAVDGEKQTAVMVSGGGEKGVKLVRAVNAMHFLEVAGEGFLNLTTIYDKDASGRHPAVHSRHFGVLGQPIVSQSLGTCSSQ